jgi:hypothetical protein
MAQLNKIAHNRLLLQAEEARELGMVKLADAIMYVLEKSEPEQAEYSHDDMSRDIYQGLWELASKVAKYYDVEDVKVEKLSKVIDSLAASFIDDLEEALGVEDQVKGPKEPKLLGESK